MHDTKLSEFNYFYKKKDYDYILSQQLNINTILLDVSQVCFILAVSTIEIHCLLHHYELYDGQDVIIGHILRVQNKWSILKRDNDIFICC